MINLDNNFFSQPGIPALNQLKQNWKWYLGLGIGLVILGALAIVFSLTSTLLSVMYLGVFILIIGFFEALKAFKMTQWGQFFLHLFISVLYLVGGFFMIANPALNALSLTLLLALFFIVTGVLRIIFALIKASPYKWWLLFNGVLTVILGAIILYQWPISGFWVIGTLLGIDALFTGWTWILLSLKAKKLPQKSQ